MFLRKKFRKEKGEIKMPTQSAPAPAPVLKSDLKPIVDRINSLMEDMSEMGDKIIDYYGEDSKPAYIACDTLHLLSRAYCMLEHGKED